MLLTILSIAVLISDSLPFIMFGVNLTILRRKSSERIESYQHKRLEYCTVFSENDFAMIRNIDITDR